MSLTLSDDAKSAKVIAGHEAIGVTVTLRDLISVAFYLQRLVAAILLVSMAIAILAWYASPVRYTAKVQLLVLAGREQSSAQGLDAPAILSIDGIRATNSEVEFLRDRSILRQMVETIGPAKIDLNLGGWLLGLLPPIPVKEQLENAVDIVDRDLKIIAPTDSNLVQVAFQHENRDTAVAAADILIEVYLRRRAEIYRNVRSPFLREKAQGYAQQLGSIEAEIRAKKEQFNVLNLEEEEKLAVNQVDGAQQRRRSQMERHAAVIAEIAATNARLAELPVQIFDFMEKTDRNDNDDFASQLTKLHMERERLKLRYQDGEPKLAEIDRQIEVLDNLRKQPRRQLSSVREVRNPALDFAASHLLQLRIESDALERSTAEIDNQIGLAQKRVDQLRDAEDTLHALERSRQVIDQLYRTVSQRTEAAVIEEEEAAVKTANIRIVENADASQHGTSRGINFALAIMAGGVVVAGAVTLLAAWNRQVFLLPDEVERALGLPLLATFNEGQHFDQGGTNSQVIFLAGRLVSSRPAGAKPFKIQIASTDDAERRFDFAAALAKELAGGQHQRTLLLDLVKDGKAQWVGVGQPQPRDEAIGGLKVAPSGVANLDVSVEATAGGVNWTRADINMVNRLFEQLGEVYDIVVIDAPSIRESLVGIRLANMADGSVLVVRAEYTRVPGALNACTQIMGAGGDMFGAVLTERKFHIPKVIHRWF